MGNESTWVKAGEDFVNMAQVMMVLPKRWLASGYEMYFAADPDCVELTNDAAAGVLAYIAAHTWTNKAE